VNIRFVTINLLLSVCKQSKGTYQEYIDDLLRISISLLNDENEQILNIAWDCVDIIIKVKFNFIEMMDFSIVEFIRIWINLNYKNVYRLFDKHYVLHNRIVENVVDS
jgi:hypothetical protein